VVVMVVLVPIVVVVVVVLVVVVWVVVTGLVVVVVVPVVVVIGARSSIGTKVLKPLTLAMIKPLVKLTFLIILCFTFCFRITI
jgi:hypothetical protein